MPPFSRAVSTYTLVTSSTNAVAVTPTAAAAGSRITVNGTSVASGTASGLINLLPGPNVIEIRVLAPDAVTAKSYLLAAQLLGSDAYLKASNTGADDLFGSSVAVSGDLIVVGAPWEDSSTTGVNSVPDQGAPRSGAAYLFRRTGGIWVQEAYLKASNTDAYDGFGSNVAVSGDVVVVGAQGEDSSTAGVNGMPDELATSSGAAYVFRRTGGAWIQEAWLKASNPGAGDYFGAVAVSGDVVVVGAQFEDSASVGINSVPDEGAPNSGAAYVFRWTGVTWTEEAYLKAFNTGAGDRFGCDVGVSGDVVVVAAPSEDSASTGVDSVWDEYAPDSGAAYVFRGSGGTWVREAYLKASNTGWGDAFGSSVAVSGDLVAVGAMAEDRVATGMAWSSGAAYVFRRTGGAWAQEAYLKASNAEDNDFFGWGVSASGDLIVVAAYGEDSSSTGVNGTPDELAPDSGAAYVFRRTGSAWVQEAYLKASNTGSGDEFGAGRAAVSGGLIVVGARLEDSDTKGVNSAPNEGALDSGAVYVFSR